jgi:hypothetical protein
MSVSVTRTLSIDFAHSSAIKGVWSDGQTVATTSHDQRLRVWAVAVGAYTRQLFSST